MTTVSALLAAYRNTPVAELREALDSLVQQTRPVDEIVLVYDGPVSDEVSRFVTAFASVHPLRVVKLAHNCGLGPALQAGLDTIDSDFVVRLDTDDVAHPERVKTQLQFMQAHPEIAALGTAVREFSADTAEADYEAGAVRTLPETHEKIVSYARINSPINHPSVMFRTADVAAVGGYTGVHFMEDYDLWARLIAAGKKLHNLPKPLTYFRVSPEQFQRRTGREMFKSERVMQANLVSYGLVGAWRARFNFIARSGYRLLPHSLLTRVYSHLFHRGG